MALSTAQQAEVWTLLQRSPVAQRWPGLRSALAGMTIQDVTSGTPIFRPGDPPLHLFAVLRGRVAVTLQEAGDTWFEQTLTPGQFFGQQALFDEAYEATARVPQEIGSATLLLMSASDLRVALERAPGLREDLLHETRASRLRRIPLTRRLTDKQVRWLAQLIEEVDFVGGAPLPVNARPGIWIIDRGQVAVTGPASAAAEGEPDWRLTAGNFFVAMGRTALVEHGLQPMRFGQNCAADTATAHVDTHLFYLPSIHADRLIDVFPDISELVRQPINIVLHLNRTPLFKDLPDKTKQHLAQFCAWEFVPAPHNITTQGNPGHSYVILRQGGALITAFDTYGRERPRSQLEMDSSYGATSLLHGQTRDATVRAVPGPSLRGWPALPGADILTLDRRDLQHAIAERPELWRDTDIVHQMRDTREAMPTYDWLDEGEVVVWRGRPHPFWLAWPLLLIFLAFLAMVLLVALLPASSRVLGGLSTLLISALILVPIAILTAINYFDDFYVISNRRVTRRVRQLLIFEERSEAPIEMIQDVTYDTRFWGRVFDFGDVTVRTASKAQPIRLLNVPRPYEVKDKLEGTRSEVMAEERGRQKEDLRRGLIKDLKLALPIPPRQRALGDVPEPTASAVRTWFRRQSGRRARRTNVPTPMTFSTWLAGHLGVLPESWRRTLFGQLPPQATMEQPGMHVWRKHWLNLIGRAGPPLVVLILVLAGGALLLSGTVTIDELDAVAVLLGWAVLFLIAAGWLWWEIQDYHNDVYIITDDRIIDIEMKPLGLSTKRREGSLEKVQNVVAQQNGFWAAVLRYGDVVISTAAADEGFTFSMVANPRVVQSVVFQKLAQYRARAEKRRDADRRQELIEALSVYHQLRGGGAQPDSFH